MKKISKLLLIILFPILTLAHGHYKKPVFDESVKYIGNGLPMELIIGKSEGKDLAYIPGWGRKFLVKGSNGYIDTLNNFTISEPDSQGDITVSANVVMVDLNSKYPDKYPKGTFYHSFSGFLHSHIYPVDGFKKIKIGDVEYETIEKIDEFSKRPLYVEKNGKFTVMPIKKMNETDPDMVYFRFVNKFSLEK